MFVSDGSGKSLATAMLGYPANLPYHFCYLQLNCRMTQVFHLNDIHHSLGTDQNMYNSFRFFWHVPQVNKQLIEEWEIRKYDSSHCRTVTSTTHQGNLHSPKKECLDFIPKKASPHAELLVATSAVAEVPMLFQELETPRNPLVMTNIEGQ